MHFLRRHFTSVAVMMLLGVAAVVVVMAQVVGAQGPRTSPSAPVTVVNTEDNPIPVQQSGPWTVTSPFAPGATATRFGPTSVSTAASFVTLVPTAPAGSMFIATYLNAVGFTDVGVALTDAICVLFIQSGVSHRQAGALPLVRNRSGFVGSEQAFLPIKAGETLEMVCDANVTSTFTVSVGGHFVPVQ